MKTKIPTIVLAFAAMVVTLHGRSPAFPAPLPQFMDKDQLARWNANQAAAQAITSSQETPTSFYTGKPYVADAGGYIHEYRTYNPEMLRWTSADPSGFPDGPNNQYYAAIPTASLDPTDL